MRILVVMAMVAGCGSSNAGVSRRLDAIEKEQRRLDGNVNALRGATTEMLADLGGKLYIAQILDEENENIYRWWCNGLTCTRREGACMADIQTAKLRNMTVRDKCIQQRTAYCRGDGATGPGTDPCLETLADCIKLTSSMNANASRACVGVE
jgi:hypothetical protein